MKKLLIIILLAGSTSLLTACGGCHTCRGAPEPSDCSGTNSYTGNWY